MSAAAREPVVAAGREPVVAVGREPVAAAGAAPGRREAAEGIALPLWNPSKRFSTGIYGPYDTRIAKTAACTNTAVTEVLHDINIFFPTGGSVNKRPGERSINKTTSRSIYIYILENYLREHLDRHTFVNRFLAYFTFSRLSSSNGMWAKLGTPRGST